MDRKQAVEEYLKSCMGHLSMGKVNAILQSKYRNKVVQLKQNRSVKTRDGHKVWCLVDWVVFTWSLW